MNGTVVLQAVDPIRHDGRDYSAGEVLLVSPDDAALLVQSGAARIPDPEELPTKPSAKRPAKATKPAGVSEGITDPEKIAHEAEATPGNGGSE